MLITSADGLTVQQAMTRVGEPPCPACHRAVLACICKSHVDVRRCAVPAEDDSLAPPRTAGFTKAHAEAVIAQVMQMYYDRDADGIARLLRQTLR